MYINGLVQDYGNSSELISNGVTSIVLSYRYAVCKGLMAIIELKVWHQRVQQAWEWEISKQQDS